MPMFVNMRKNKVNSIFCWYSSVKLTLSDFANDDVNWFTILLEIGRKGGRKERRKEKEEKKREKKRRKISSNISLVSREEIFNLFSCRKRQSFNMFIYVANLRRNSFCSIPNSMTTEVNFDKTSHILYPYRTL